MGDELIGKLKDHFNTNMNAEAQQILTKCMTPATQEAFVTPGF